MKVWKLMTYAATIMAVVVAFGVSYANVWIDENFDDSVAWDDLDLYDYTPPTTPPTGFENAQGSLSTSRAFDGSTSYQLTAGQVVSVTDGVENPGNGPLQYLQMAVSVGSLGSATMAELRYRFLDPDNAVNSYFIKFVVNGSQVDMYAGEDLKGYKSVLLDTIPNTTAWRYLTIQVMKNTGTESDTTLGQTGIPRGVRFYSSSTVAQATAPLEGSGATIPQFMGWRLEVFSGSLFIDNVYWEGGMTYDSTAYANRNIRDLASGAPLGVEEWRMY